MNRFAGFEARERRVGGSALVTGTEVHPSASGASCVVTTDSESSRFTRRNSHVQSIELRTHVFIDSLQPQLAAYHPEMCPASSLLDGSLLVARLIPASASCCCHSLIVFRYLLQAPHPVTYVPPHYKNLADVEPSSCPPTPLLIQS